MFDVEVTVDAANPPTVRAPDVIVTYTSVVDADPARCAASDVLVAIEIISPGTRRTDRVTKF